MSDLTEKCQPIKSTSSDTYQPPPDLQGGADDKGFGGKEREGGRGRRAEDTTSWVFNGRDSTLSGMSGEMRSIEYCEVPLIVLLHC